MIFIAGSSANASTDQKSETKSQLAPSLQHKSFGYEQSRLFKSGLDSRKKRQVDSKAETKAYADGLAYFNNYGSWPVGYNQHYSLLNYNGLNPTMFNPYYAL